LAVNPYTGFEDTKRLQPARTVKKVAVVGGGPAGCEAAKTALLRGHEVTLFEQSDRLGGQLRLSAQMAFKHDVARYLDNLEYQMQQLQPAGLKLVFGRRAEAADLNGFDTVICACGVKEKPKLPTGIEHLTHIEVRSFLNQQYYLELGERKRITIIGGGLVGCEVAYELALQGHEVTVLEQAPHLMMEVVNANRAMMLWLMMGYGSVGKNRGQLDQPIKVYTTVGNLVGQPEKLSFTVSCKRPAAYTPWLPLIPENVHNPFAYREKGKREEISIAADLVIVAYGSAADSSLYYELLNDNQYEVYRVGDCLTPGRVWEAVNSANEVARNI